MCNEHAVDRTVRRNRNAVDERVNRIAQKLETGDKRHIKRCGREFFAEGARMIEHDFAGPAVDEGTGVEILNATNPEQPAFSHASKLDALVVRLPPQPWLCSTIGTGWAASAPTGLNSE
jgi:hypothetical protein